MRLKSDKVNGHVWVASFEVLDVLHEPMSDVDWMVFGVVGVELCDYFGVCHIVYMIS